MSEDVPPYGNQHAGSRATHHSSPSLFERISSYAKYAAAVTAVVASLATVFALYRTADFQYRAAREAVVQQREALNQQYVAMAIGLLAKKPDDDIGRALRDWEVDVFKKFAPIPISPAVEQSLREGAAIPIRGDAVSGTGAVGKPQ